MSIVFVIDSEGKPLLPTHPARARKLLRKRSATVKQVVPFTIQLNRKIDNPVGNFEVGVDDGAKFVGLAIKNTKTNKIVFCGQIDHRLDVKLKMEKRKNYRVTRRNKLRHRKPRFSNRIRNKLSPSIRQRKEVITRVVKDMMKRLNITSVKVEEVCFNHKVHNYGKSFSLVEIGKNYLSSRIQQMGLEYKNTFGYVTKDNRVNLGLSKTHINDACAILNSNELPSVEYHIKPKRTKVWENNPSKKHSEKNGFRHYDLVKTFNKNSGYIVGSVKSLKEQRMSLRTKKGNNASASYKRTKLLQRFSGIVYMF